MRTILFIIATLHITCLPTTALAQSGSLDNTFGAGGKVITSLGGFGDKGNSVAIQSDGKILFGGFTQSSFISSDFVIVRCNKDGSLDTTFGTGGKVNTHIENRSEGNSLAIQSDGKILLGGASKWFINLARYNSDGTLDTTFGTGGKVITDINGYYSEQCKSLAIQGDGKILLGGYGKHNSNDNAYFVLVRYNNNGTLDSTFGTQGEVIGRAGLGYSMAIQSDGKILIGGSYSFAFALVRYNANGNLDSSFGTGGEIITPIGNSGEANSLGIQNDGKIVLGGYSYNNSGNSGFALVRYNNDGTLDTTFGIKGTVITNVGDSWGVGNSVSFQSDGKILLAGNATNGSNFSNFALVRYNGFGVLDNSFGVGGKAITSMGASYSRGNSLTIQSDGKIVLGGYSYNGSKTDMALARYDGDVVGMEKTVGKQRGCKIYPNPFNSSTTIQFDTPLQNAEINIYNIFGQEVKQIANISGHEIQIFRNNLACGVYFFQLTEKNEIISVQKLVINEE